jgi:hypothetical protein
MFLRFDGVGVDGSGIAVRRVAVEEPDGLSMNPSGSAGMTRQSSGLALKGSSG